MRKWTMIVVAGALAGVLAAACGGGNEGDGDRTPRPSPTAARKVVEAPIDEAEIIVRESFPPQYAVRIVSGLPNGCHEFNAAELTRQDTTIRIRVTNTVPVDPDIACTQIYGQHEETVELGTDFEPGTLYTVNVNDRTLTFTAE